MISINNKLEYYILKMKIFEIMIKRIDKTKENILRNDFYGFKSIPSHLLKLYLSKMHTVKIIQLYKSKWERQNYWNRFFSLSNLNMRHKCKMPYNSKIIFRNNTAYNYISIKCHAEKHKWHAIKNYINMHKMSDNPCTNFCHSLNSFKRIKNRRNSVRRRIWNEKE